DLAGRLEGRAARLLQIVAARGEHVVAAHVEAGFQQVRRHRRAHDAQPDDADGFHFFFLLFFFATGFLGAPTGFALTRIAAMTQGSLPRTLQEWLVPRCTRMSPARSSFSSRSMMAKISPLS